MPITALDHVQLAVPHGREAEARAFYGGLLGLAEVQKPPNLAKRGGCWFARGAVRVHLGVEEAFRPARKAHPAIVTDDLPALAAALEASGHPVTPDCAIAGVARVFVDDPFGNRVELIQAPGG
jgi:catechol 2,3-dioxygenase-like lactoylglutathione lyase family enzyme